MKFLVKIFLVFGLFFTIGINFGYSTQYGDTGVSGNQYDRKIDSNNRMGANNINNDRLNQIGGGDDFIQTQEGGENGVYHFLLKVAQSLKNIFFVLATIYFLITALKLLLAEGSSDEQFTKFKNGFKWITAGIIVMQIAYSYTLSIYNQKIGSAIAGNLIKNIIEPLIQLLVYAVAFFFIAVMVFAFYKIITAGGDEEKAKQGKMSIFYAFMGFIVVKLASYFVSATYSKTLCEVDGVTCQNVKELSENSKIIFTVINWLNGFVGIIVVLMIMYAGFQIIFSGGEDDKIKNAKKSIIYIIIGILILIFNYFILTFFLQDNLLK